MTLVWIDQNGHEVNSNKWILALGGKQITHRGCAYENEINQINDPPKKRKRFNVVNKKGLDPLSGKLTCRFFYGDSDKLRHKPTEKSNDSLCALHIWTFAGNLKDIQLNMDPQCVLAVWFVCAFRALIYFTIK